MSDKSPSRTSCITFDLAEAKRLWMWVLSNQGLTDGKKFTSLEELAHASLGLHAARLQSPFATVLARSTSQDVALNLFNEPSRKLLMTVRCMRKTLHMLPPRLAAIAHAATVHFRKRDALRAIINANVSIVEVESAIGAVVSLLAEKGSLFHRDIETRLINRRRSRTIIRLAIKLAWETGVLLYKNHSTGWNQEDRRFGLMSAIHPGLDMNMEKKEAMGELFVTYFDRYGPASLHDAMWWSGLSRTDVLAGLQTSGREVITVKTPWIEAPLYMFRDRLEEFLCDDGENHLIRETSISFLAHEDVALKAYFESRDRYLAGLHSRIVFNQIGEVLPTILLGGHVIGTWMWNKKAKKVEPSILPGYATTVVRKEVMERADALSEAFQLGLVSSCFKRRSTGPARTP